MMKFSTVFTPQLYPCLSNVMSVLGQAKRGRFVFPDHTRTLKCALRGGRGRNPSALLLWLRRRLRATESAFYLLYDEFRTFSVLLGRVWASSWMCWTEVRVSVHHIRVWERGKREAWWWCDGGTTAKYTDRFGGSAVAQAAKVPHQNSTMVVLKQELMLIDLNIKWNTAKFWPRILSFVNQGRSVTVTHQTFSTHSFWLDSKMARKYEQRASSSNY